jgi:uncharacterized membrane protein YcaP (DUF421 family)
LKAKPTEGVMIDTLPNQIYRWSDAVLGLSNKAENLGFGHMAARAFLMYILLIWLIRCAKKRFLGEATAFDVILVIVLGSIAARGLTGGAPYFPCVLAMAVLVVMHWLFSYIAQRSPWFSALLKGHSTLLIADGRIQHEPLRASHMSRDDLDEDLRQQGVADPAEVREARLERSGRLSVLRK